MFALTSSREAPKEKPERDPDYDDRMPPFEGINMADDPAQRDNRHWQLKPSNPA
ncbi:hypothetical protein IFR05_013970 [Cadophora sp. M221]|nr:hypothetical protein IFR05_013970 [Cadophora sp. M221]